MDSKTFLADLNPRPLTLADGGPLEPPGLMIGPGSGGLEVAVARSQRKPTQDALRTAWKDRQGGRAAPVLLVALHADRAALCGPAGEPPPVFLDLDTGQVERICRTALAERNRHAAARFLWSVLPEVSESQIPGLRNRGLFATHELEKGVPERSDWPQAQREATALLDKRGRDLLAGLGFQVSDSNQQYAILRCGQTKMAVAVFLDRSEACDIASDRFGGMTPVQHALAKADEENLDYVLVDHGSSLRIHTVAGKGVVHEAIRANDAGLLRDRNLLEFAPATEAAIRRLLALLESGTVEVRRYEKGFLNGKAFVFADDEGVLAGSSNFTAAGLTSNLELNLGRYDPTPVRQRPSVWRAKSSPAGR